MEVLGNDYLCIELDRWGNGNYIVTNDSRANDPNSCQWFYAYVAEIAHSCGLPENTTYIEVANEIVKVNRSLSLIRLRLIDERSLKGED
ncbi:hypothetical protein L1987_35872 [Smallanthus sonchifolius]|uniref:Uncharacterized protein n=1 Tax=Smallanthus sonchifolius TaxID=185202 RepID=A0ACB9HDA6_9ASTR|nr:hypothetical protein L1987_35872 [Smallanthus sonchifolius]